MKTTILLLWLFFFATLSYAHQREVDDLRQALQNHPQEDTTKIRLLTELAWWRYYFNQDTTLLLLNQALSIAEKLKEERAIGVANRELAYCYAYYNLKEYDKALEYERKALQSIEKTKDKLQISLALLDIGHLYASKNQHQEALNYYFKALQGFEALKNQEYITYTLLDIKVAYEKMDNKGKATEFSEKLNQAISKITDKSHLAKIWFCMAGIGFWKFQFHEVLEYSLKSEKLYEDINDIKRKRIVLAYIIFLYHGIAKSYNDDTAIAKTMIYYEKLLKLIEKDNQQVFNPIGFQDKQLAYYCTVGVGFFSGNEYTAANNFMGWAFSWQGRDLEKAKMYHLKAKTMAEKENDVRGLSLSIDGLGQIYFFQGKYQEALDIFLQINKGKLLGNHKSMIAQCYQKLGKLQESLKYALEAEKDLQQSNNLFWYTGVCDLLSKIYADLKQYEQAYFYQKKTQMLGDSLKIQDNVQKITTLEKQQEITLLEKDKQIQAEENKNQRLWLFSASGAFLSAILLAFILYRNSQNKQKANLLLQEKNEEITQQTQALQNKNRELEIETALERVRSRTMAMQRSDELREVVATLYEQVQYLGFKYGAISILIMDKNTRDLVQWVGGLTHSEYPVGYNIKYFDHPVCNAYFTNWEKGIKYIEIPLSGEIKSSYDKHLFNETDFKFFPEDLKTYMQSLKSIVFTCVFFKQGALHWGPERVVNEEQTQILQKFAIVFEQTYTRFLDLQKAEAQAREAQIEAALERVRSRTMAMQKSIELSEVVAVIFQEKEKLGFNLNLCNIVLFDNNTFECDYWLANQDNSIAAQNYHIPYFEHPLYKYQLNTWKEAKPYAEFELAGEEKNTWDEILMTKTDVKNVDEATWEMMKKIDHILLSSVAIKYGLLQVIGVEKLTDEFVSILQRFAKVFEQTYTRFLDLQKAEAQAREAQIEAALERVRSQAMSMQKSDELAKIIRLINQELVKLDTNLDRSFIMLLDANEGGATWWMASSVEPSLLQGYQIPYHDHPPHIAYLEAWKKQISRWEYILTGNEKKQWDEFLFNQTELSQLPKFIISNMTGFDTAYLSASFNKYGCISTGSFTPITPISMDLLVRFSYMFEQTYTRFLDLQKAEAQAEKAKLDFIQIQTEKKRAEDALLELQTTQAQLIQAEKLAVMGKLVASVAHEINTPLGAIRASAGNIVTDLNEALQELPKLFQLLSAEQQENFFALVSKALETKILLSSREERIARKELEKELESYDVAEADELAYELTDMGIYENISAFLPIFKDENALFVTKIAHHLVNQQRSTDNIQLAVDRASKVVFALKTYARHDQSGEKMKANVSTGIETVLTLYHNLLKQNTEVIRNYSEVPEIFCYPDELNQVWTNLIHNAMHAMTSKGVLEIGISQIENSIEVSIKDNGSGIPEAIKPKIFDAFFTTKPEGEGSGLGLDIVKKIIDKHKGEIGFESEEGKGTTFWVRLPIGV